MRRIRVCRVASFGSDDLRKDQYIVDAKIREVATERRTRRCSCQAAACVSPCVERHLVVRFPQDRVLHELKDRNTTLQGLPMHQ